MMAASLVIPGRRDIEANSFHFIKVTIPEGNEGLLHTYLEAISGDPDIYIQYDTPPTKDYVYGHTNYQRTLTGGGDNYGNWVPLGYYREQQLKPGDWWIAVWANADNVRYRLRLSRGDIQSMNQNGGSVTGQALAAGNMRYYKVDIPSANTPLDGYSTCEESSGDVVMFCGTPFLPVRHKLAPC